MRAVHAEFHNLVGLDNEIDLITPQCPNGYCGLVGVLKSVFCGSVRNPKRTLSVHIYMIVLLLVGMTGEAQKHLRRFCIIPDVTASRIVEVV